MRYLFFDIECCNGEHICEFGYVICDESFNVVERNVITINPERPFHLIGRRGSDDIQLFFDEEVYFSSPAFPFYYQRIKSLIEAPDQIVAGHAIANDAIFIKTACIRYGLDPINFKFVDSQRIYSEFSNEKQLISLESAEEIFNLEKPKYLHKSDEDALLTMRLVKSICERLGASLSDIIISFPSVCGKSDNFEIEYSGESLEEIFEAIAKTPHLLSNAKKQKAIKQFYKNADPSCEIIHSELFGKSLCFSSEFEKNFPRKTITLIQQIINHGAKYNTKVSDNNYYVATNDEISAEDTSVHSRYYSANCAKASGNDISIISFDRLLEILNISADDLENMPMPKAPEKKPFGATPRTYSRGYSKSTLGEQLKAKGIDLLKLYSNV